LEELVYVKIKIIKKVQILKICTFIVQNYLNLSQQIIKIDINNVDKYAKSVICTITFISIY